MYPYLFAFDFDGTAFSTSQPSVEGMTVKQAYDQSVKDIFGLVGAALYEEGGGLKNRAPLEVVGELLASTYRDDFLASARQYYEDHREDLLAIVSSVKGVSIDAWDEAQAGSMITEMLVRRKLQLLLPQIGIENESGQVWPPPCQGFVEFWQYLGKLQKEGIIQTAIISSGHDSFIQKTFDLYGLPMPDYMVTDDDIRGRSCPEPAQRVKPHQLPLALVYRQWRMEKGSVYDIHDHASNARGHMVYFGDDKNKDGGLAHGARILFGHFVPQSLWEYDEDEMNVSFGDWAEVESWMRSHEEKLREGSLLDGELKGGEDLGIPHGFGKERE